MNRMFCIACAINVIFLSVPFIAPVWSAEDASTDGRIEKLEQENQSLRQLIEEMQDRLNYLEQKSAELSSQVKGKDSGKDSQKDESEEGVAADEEAWNKLSENSERGDSAITEGSGDLSEEEGKAKGREWLPSLAGEEFRLGGRLQFNYFDPENERELQSAIPANPGGSFEVDELRLYIDADFKNNIRFFSIVDFEGDESGLVEAYVDLEELPLNSELRLGLQPRFYRPSRYTEYYPLNGQAFWRSRDLGVTWKGEYAPFFAYASLLNGVRLDDRFMKLDNTDPVLGDDRESLDVNGSKEISVGLGMEWDFVNYGKFTLLGFGAKGDLSDRDLDFLFRNMPGYPLSLEDKREMAGVNLDYGIGEWDFFAQAIAARDGEIERLGWYTEGSYKFNFSGMKYLNSLRPLVRYGMLNTDIAPVPFGVNSSMSWDRQQWVFALVSELSRNVLMRAEYQLNEEDTGGPEANNNEWLLQLEVQF